MPACRCTLTGVLALVVVPSPSCPVVLRPQARTVRLAVPAALMPAVTAWPTSDRFWWAWCAAALAAVAAITEPLATVSAGIASAAAARRPGERSPATAFTVAPRWNIGPVVSPARAAVKRRVRWMRCMTISSDSA